MDDLMELVRQNPDLDCELIEKAYAFARNAHEGQKRIGGEDFFSHPVEVSHTLLCSSEVSCDTEMICAALLHDTVEDTKVNFEDIEENFTHSITQLVDALTKIEHAEDVQINHAMTHEKIMKHGLLDRRVFIIKLADVLHNLRTAGVMIDQKKKRYAKEALFFYVPIAQKLGMQTFEHEIARLANKYLNEPLLDARI